MAWRDWLDIPAVQAQMKHASAVLPALVSFYLLTLAVKWILGPGWLATFFQWIDDCVLAVLVLLFGLRMIYDIWRNLKHGGGTNVVFVA